MPSAFLGCPENISEGVRFGIEFADAVISNENRRWLRDLPLMYAGFISGRSYFLVHGSPWDSINHYLYQDNPLLNRMEEFKYDLVVFGQTHRQFSRDHQGRIIVNPGSVGQSREKCGAASAAIYDTDNGKLELIQRPYDTRPVIDMARNNGAGTWIEKHLI
jgi:predicted phosphodiesterase